jgi:hypothetical protein
MDVLYASILAIPLPWHDNAHAEPYTDLYSGVQKY